jgi:DUF3060 family protein
MKKQGLMFLIALTTISVLGGGCVETVPGKDTSTTTVIDKDSNPQVQVDRDVTSKTETSTSVVQQPPTQTTTTTDSKVEVEVDTEKSSDQTSMDSNQENVSNTTVSTRGLTFNVDQETVTRETEAQTVAISADGGSYTLDGSVTDLKVTGNENTVTVDSATRIDVSGNKNHVKWDEGDPVLYDTGTGNLLEKAL